MSYSKMLFGGTGVYIVVPFMDMTFELLFDLHPSAKSYFNIADYCSEDSYTITIKRLTAITAFNMRNIWKTVIDN